MAASADLPYSQGIADRYNCRSSCFCAARFYVLISTCFESDPPESATDKRRFGYSRDKRPDCVQVVIALVVTPEGFPLGYV